MDSPDLISIFVRPLEKRGIQHMISGSVASAAYGEPRATFDVDIAVWISPQQAGQFNSIYPEEEYYVPPPDVIAIEAARSVEGHFNVIHHATGLKADFYPCRVHPYFEWAWQRRRTIKLADGPAVFCPPEYVILRKLEFFREGGGEKHLRDIVGIVSQQGDTLDHGMLTEATSRLRLEPEWRRALSMTS
jgi:hypothetical protein